MEPCQGPLSRLCKISYRIAAAAALTPSEPIRPRKGRAIAFGNIGDNEELSYPPLEGEGRTRQTKFDVFGVG